MNNKKEENEKTIRSETEGKTLKLQPSMNSRQEK